MQTKIMNTKQQYRQDYIKSEQHSQDELDKTLIKLSGGAFAITFAFVSNFIDNEPVLVVWLIASWLSWGASIVCSLTSYYLNTLAFRKAIDELDNGKDFENADLGGYYTKALNILNPISLGLFTAGIICISVFVTLNI